MLQTERRGEALEYQSALVVPECSRTLQQVLDVLEIEVRLRQRLEAELVRLQTALEDARAELAEVRARPER